jgi:hypothetical protein
MHQVTQNHLLSSVGKKKKRKEGGGGGGVCEKSFLVSGRLMGWMKLTFWSTE